MIKVADFGLTEDMYATNYYHRNHHGGGGGGERGAGNEEKVPIRWMALESIESDIYNEMTDVVRAEVISVTVGYVCCCSGHLE